VVVSDHEGHQLIQRQPEIAIFIMLSCRYRLLVDLQAY
jgi:hypothetical protein